VLNSFIRTYPEHPSSETESRPSGGGARWYYLPGCPCCPDVWERDNAVAPAVAISPWTMHGAVLRAGDPAFPRNMAARVAGRACRRCGGFSGASATDGRQLGSRTEL
jgi:hypothetical protein